MNINRRKFFRVAAVGVAAASLPAFLQPEKIHGKSITPLHNGLYAWEEYGFAIFDPPPQEPQDFPLRYDPYLTQYKLEWHEVEDRLFSQEDIKRCREQYQKHQEERLAEILCGPLRHGVYSSDIFLVDSLSTHATVEFPLDILRAEI